MTMPDGCDPRRETGYRLDELASAFDRVRHPRDWMAPIEAEIDPSARPLVEQAVLWFTQTPPEFTPAPDASGRLVVRAAGYRGRPTGGTDAELAGPG